VRRPSAAFDSNLPHRFGPDVAAEMRGPEKTLSDFEGDGCLMGEMHDQPDVQLLREYARHGNEAAFREIVLRHTDLIYSSALRQVASPDLARDVAQSVFTDLARKARPLAESLGENASILGWLFRSTRFAALNQLRNDRRRQTRERHVMEHFNPASETASEWDRIQPMLDEAMAALSDEDRDALLLRFFKNQDFRAVGESLGISDDAAQKRVSRAVEKLREFFSKQKIAIGASGLAVLISANAVQSAPIGLAAAISAAAVLTGATISTSTAVATTKAIAMTALQKSIIGATLAVFAGTGIFEAHLTSQLREQNQILQKQQMPLTEQIRQLQSALNDATNQLAGLLAENAQLKSNSNEIELLKLRGEITQLKTADSQKENDPTEIAAEALAAKVNQLKQRLEQMPNEKIPELQYLTAQDWLRGVNYSGDLKTDDDLDRALSQLRRDAKRTFANSMGAALDNYIADNNGQLPGDISQLEPYFNPPIDGTILQRYQLLQTGNLSDVPNNEPLIAEKAPVDDQYDTLFKISATGYSYQGTGTAWVNGSGTGGFGTNITAKIKPFERQN
jgi:RNA polymerase sigma factor (sigma-70 family)